MPKSSAKSLIIPEILFVSIKAPEQMQIALIPCWPNSAAITLVKPSMAAQAEANPAILGVLVLDTDAVNSKMVPSDPDWIICLAATLEVRNCDPQILCKGFRNCSKVAIVV